MQWPIIFCVLLACAAASDTNDDTRPKRDLQYLKNLIASSIFGIQQNQSSPAPILVQSDENVKIYRIPGMDNLLVRTEPKNSYRIEQAVPVEPIVEDPINVLETYLGTKTIDETVTALQGIRNLLASGIIIKPKPYVSLKPSKLPLIPVIPPPKPIPIVQEFIPVRPLDYPEIIAINVPNQYSYKQLKSDGSVTRYTSKDGGDVIVTESRQPMPLPPPYIVERLKQVCMQPIPVRPLLQPKPIRAARPVQYNVPFVPLPPAMPVITGPSNVKVKPFSIREEINVRPLIKESDLVVPGSMLLPPMPPALFLKKDVSGMESPLFRPHKAFIGPVPIGSYPQPHFYQGQNLFEPIRSSINTKGEVKVERFQNKKGLTYSGTMHHQIPVRKTHHVAILERPARMPVPPGPIIKRLENVVALAHAVHPPKVSAGYSFKIGSDFRNVSVSTDRSTVNNDIKYVTTNTSPVSSYSYKQVGSGGVTTITGNEMNTNTVNIVNRLNTVPVLPNQVVVSEIIKQQEPKAVLFTSPVSSTYVYKQINQNAVQPDAVVKLDNVKDTEVKQVFTHEHILADGSMKPCAEVHVNPVQEVKKNEESKKPDDFVYIPPLINEAPVSGMASNQITIPTAIPSGVKLQTVPILKIDNEKLNITTQFSYKQLTDGGMLTNNNGNIIIKEFISNSPKADETNQTAKAVEGSLTDNPIVVVDESFYTNKEKRDSSTSSGKDKSDNVVSDEASDTKHGHEKHMRGDIPDAMS